jgi:hypothetical protein
MATSTIKRIPTDGSCLNWRSYTSIDDAIKGEWQNLAPGFSVYAAYIQGGGLRIFMAAKDGNYFLFAITISSTEIHSLVTFNSGSSWTEKSVALS